MDREVDDMSTAYKAFAEAIASFLESMQATEGRKNDPLTEVALANVKVQYENFKATCDQADEKLDHSKKMLIAEYFDSAANFVDSPTKGTTVIGSSPLSAAKDAETGVETVKGLENAAGKTGGASGAVKGCEDGKL